MREQGANERLVQENSECLVQENNDWTQKIVMLNAQLDQERTKLAASNKLNRDRAVQLKLNEKDIADLKKKATISLCGAH